ncbi:MAG: GNAT family N-acetyltransferase [Pseudanabaena sp. Salubria-1]|nr:GNAT family N-acetyltransferase [Pseudanabaena sp. Salubria-1]
MLKDAESLYQLLIKSTEDYIRYFSPFTFEIDTISKLLLNAEKDQIYGVELNDGISTRIIGFYMLRGLDEGYVDPMYGVFISQEFSSMGIAKLTLSHAEVFCKMNNFSRLLLKVYVKNEKAKNLYSFLGFKTSIKLSNDILLMEKEFTN